jgi:hypothetical protein
MESRLYMRRRFINTTLYSFVSGSEITTPPYFRLILRILLNSQAGCFPESYPSFLLSLQPLNSQLKVIHFTLHFVARFQVEGKIPKTHSSLRHRNKFFNIIETYYSNSSLRSSWQSPVLSFVGSLSFWMKMTESVLQYKKTAPTYSDTRTLLAKLVTSRRQLLQR